MRTKEEILQYFREIFGDDVCLEEDLDPDATIFDAITLEKGHKYIKKQLGHRVQVLRVLVYKKFKHRRGEMNPFEFDKRVEKYLDNILVKNNYQLESLIKKVREEIN